MKDRLDIKTKRHNEFSSKFEVGGNKYIVQTEDLGPKTLKVVTNAYLKGAIVNSISTDYAHLAGTADLEQKVREMMERQHASATAALTQKHPEKVRSKASFADEIRKAQKKRDHPAALDAVTQALVLYPADPYFLSFCGLFTATAERKRVKEGCSICEEAIRALSRLPAADKEFFYPLLHLNLGKAYLLGRKRKEALDAFREGLKYDPKHEELLSEITRLGVRQSPVLSFLDRGNALNKFLGRLRHKMQSR